MAEQLKLPKRIYERLRAEARAALPHECCGLLGGYGEDVTELFAASNHLASPNAFEIAPQELFDIFRELRARKLELVGIYHSHPAGDNAPSQRDRERAYYPEAAYVIVAPGDDAPEPVRAFHLHGDGWQELSVELTD
jgi:proteasome lid subunit RPN8/RPN11